MNTQRAAVLAADIPGAISRQVNRRDQARSLHGTLAEHEFFIDVYGAGRIAPQALTFSFGFTRRPVMVAGVTLHEADSVIGATPTVRAAASDWKITDTGLYLGCTVNISVTGHRRQQARVALLFSGIGLSYPLGRGLDAFDPNDPI